MLRVQTFQANGGLFAKSAGITHSGVEASSFIHGQESVAVDPFDANDPLRNCKELQDT